MALFSSKKQKAQQANAQQPSPEQMQQIQRSIQGVKADPSGFLRQNFGVRIPDGSNNPYQIINHLASSGQLNAQQMRALEQIKRMGALR